MGYSLSDELSIFANCSVTHRRERCRRRILGYGWWICWYRGAASSVDQFSKKLPHFAFARFDARLLQHSVSFLHAGAAQQTS
jgi:hypothetical protein